MSAFAACPERYQRALELLERLEGSAPERVDASLREL